MAGDLEVPKEAAIGTQPSSVSLNSVEKSAEPSVLDVNEKGVDGSRPVSGEDIREKEAAAAVVGEEEDDESQYPTGIKLVLISIAVCLAVFCMALDNTIIATAIPKITDAFGALNDVGWYISVYLLTTCAFQLIFGKLYTFYNVKWVFLTALAIFEVGSVVCGAAPTSTALIVGRAIAGLGSAGIFSGAILIVTHTVPLRKRAAYTGMVGGMYGIASVAGPLLGGAFTDSKSLTWRWCFYINLPFGAVTALFLFFFFKAPRKHTAGKTPLLQQFDQMDLPGTAVFLPGVICLLLALQWGGTKYEWKNGRIIALLVIAGLLLISFVVLQVLRGEKATVPPRVFKNRDIWGSALYAFCLGGAFFVAMFYLPIWFQAIKGASAVKSGIMSLPFVLGLVVFSIVAGGLITVIGYYTPFMWLGTILMPIGAGLITTLHPDSGHNEWIGYQIIFGFGVGAGMQQPLLAAQAALPLADIPIGTAIIMFGQILGGAIIASVGQNVFTNQLVRNLKATVQGVDPTFVLGIGATEVQNRIPAADLSAVTSAYSKAINQALYVSVAMAALSVFPLLAIRWISIKGKNLAPAAGA